MPLLDVLFDDLVACEGLLDARDDQFARRTFVRAVFAFMEGFIYWLKGELLDYAVHDVFTRRDIPIGKLALLQDEIPKLSKQGVIQTEPNRASFLSMCAFVLRCWAEQTGTDPAAFFSDNGWNELQKALAVRHRITHPKAAADLDISEAEVRTVRLGCRWVHHCLARTIADFARQHPDVAAVLAKNASGVRT